MLNLSAKVSQLAQRTPRVRGLHKAACSFPAVDKAADHSHDDLFSSGQFVGEIASCVHECN